MGLGTWPAVTKDTWAERCGGFICPSMPLQDPLEVIIQNPHIAELLTFVQVTDPTSTITGPRSPCTLISLCTLGLGRPHNCTREPPTAPLEDSELGTGARGHLPEPFPSFSPSGAMGDPWVTRGPWV